MPVQLKPFKGKRKQSGMIYEGHFNSVTEEYDPAFSYTVETQFLLNTINRSCNYLPYVLYPSLEKTEVKCEFFTGERAASEVAQSHTGGLPCP